MCRLLVSVFSGVGSVLYVVVLLVYKVLLLVFGIISVCRIDVCG